MTSKRLLVSLAALLLALAAWLWWSADNAQEHARQEPLQCALPAQPPSAAHPGMVWVPGGTLQLGDSVYREELPVRSVVVKGFWMDRTSPGRTST